VVGDSGSRNSFGAIGRVSAGSIGVKSLAMKNLRLAILDLVAAIAGLPGLSKTFAHDFVIDVWWRNKLKDRPN
jgi:hypothetical protein